MNLRPRAKRTTLRWAPRCALRSSLKQAFQAGAKQNRRVHPRTRADVGVRSFARECTAARRSATIRVEPTGQARPGSASISVMEAFDEEAIVSQHADDRCGTYGHTGSRAVTRRGGDTLGKFCSGSGTASRIPQTSALKPSAKWTLRDTHASPCASEP